MRSHFKKVFFRKVRNFLINAMLANNIENYGNVLKENKGKEGEILNAQLRYNGITMGKHFKRKILDSHSPPSNSPPCSELESLEVKAAGERLATTTSDASIDSIHTYERGITHLSL